MDTRSIDERLRGVYERSAPAVNEAVFRARLRRNTGRRPARALAVRHPRRRLVLAALSTVVVLAALGFGVSTLVERLDRDQSVVVITDDSMSPGTTSAGSETTAGVTDSTGTDDRPATTSSTTLFPMQHSFKQALAEEGYNFTMFTKQEGDTSILVVWVIVDRDETTQEAREAILDRVVALAEKYGASEAAGGRMRVELSDAPPGEFIKDYIFESRDFDLAKTTTSTVTPYGPPFIEANVTVSGPAPITRPQPDYVLLTATLGSEQPQFGLQADGLWAPGGLAVSPDGGTFAIADGVNSRMKVFTGGGRARAILMNTIPAPEGHDLGGDVVMDGEGNIYVLGHSFQTPEILRFHTGDGQVTVFPIAESPSPSRLFLEGENLWVQGADQKSYPVAGIGPTLSLEWDGEKSGVPTGGYVVAVTSAKSPTVSIEVSSPGGEPRKLFSISSSDLNIAYADILGTDSDGDLYVRLNLQPTEDWMGTASQLIVAISPGGEKVGELRLPYDGYIGSGQICLGADGTVYELLTTQDELSVVAHSLKTD